MNDEQIIQGLANGKEEAYEFLYASHYNALCKYATFYVKDAFISETVVGDVIFNIWRKRSTLEIQSLRSYLLRAVRNGCINYIEQQKRQEQLKSKIGNIHQQDQNHKEEHESPLTQLLEKELDLKIEKSINSMSTQTRNIFKLSRFDDLKYGEIAEKLNVSIDTVKYHMKIALLHLRKDLMNY